MVINLKLLQCLKNQKARKIFGKKELSIIAKQLAGLRLTQSEKNRLSRDIRPKLEFIGEIAQFRDEFRLAKSQDNKALMGKAVDAILRDGQKDTIEAILLFGSFADGTFSSLSDIDICVVFRKNPTLQEATEFRMRVSGEIPEKINVHVFNILPQKLKRAIARSHKVLYSSGEFDNLDFSVRYIKDEDYFIRMGRISGEAA